MLQQRTTFLALFGSLLALWSCSKPDAAGAAPKASGATTSVVPSASAEAKSLATTKGARTYGGAYDAKRATITVPSESDWKGFKWRGDDASTETGAGQLTLTVGADGRVSGNGDGALGAFEVIGWSEQKVITGTVRPRDATSGSPMGTLYAVAEGDSLEGQLQVSSSEASSLRTATFVLKPK